VIAVRAVVKYVSGAGETRFTEVPEPEPGPGQVKIRVVAAGVCGSDVRMFDTDMGKRRIRPPVVLGHEGAGVVAAVGPGVTRFQPGDPVVAETTYTTCGHCRHCAEGALNQCPDRRGLGSGVNGYFAEYVVIREESVHRLPPSISPEEAAATEPLACVVHLVLERAPVRVGQTAVIFGPGPLGLLAVQVVRACGARPVLVGTPRSAHRLIVGRELGAAVTLVDGEDDVPATIRSLTGGEGADAAFECAGTERSFQAACLSVRRRGLVGVAAAPVEPVRFDVNHLFFQEINLRTALSSTPSSWRSALELLATGQVRLSPLITHRLPLQQWQSAYDIVRRRAGIKVLLLPGQAPSSEEGSDTP
jgi:L-iditol 2-dehydrogenase